MKLELERSVFVLRSAADHMETPSGYTNKVPQPRLITDRVEQHSERMILEFQSPDFAIWNVAWNVQNSARGFKVFNNGRIPPNELERSIAHLAEELLFDRMPSVTAAAIAVNVVYGFLEIDDEVIPHFANFLQYVRRVGAAKENNEFTRYDDLHIGICNSHL